MATILLLFKSSILVSDYSFRASHSYFMDTILLLLSQDFNFNYSFCSLWCFLLCHSLFHQNSAPPPPTPAVFFFFPFWVGLFYVGGFPGGAIGKEPACQCRRYTTCGFNPWVRKIPWRRAWQPTPVFLPGESHGQRSLEGYSPLGRTRVRYDWSDLAHTFHIGGFPQMSGGGWLFVHMWVMC